MNKQPLAIGNVYIFQRGESFRYADLVVGFNKSLGRFLLIRISHFHGNAWYQEVKSDYYEGFYDDVGPVNPKYHKDFIRFLFETEEYVWKKEK